MIENNIVVVKDLEKKYKSGTHAVKGINFEVKKGKFLECLARMELVKPLLCR